MSNKIVLGEAIHGCVDAAFKDVDAVYHGQTSLSTEELIEYQMKSISADLCIPEDNLFGRGLSHPDDEFLQFYEEINNNRSIFFEEQLNRIDYILYRARRRPIINEIRKSRNKKTRHKHYEVRRNNY